MTTPLPGRNDPCHCGSGKKYKKCCQEADEQRASAARQAHAQEEPAGLDLAAKALAEAVDDAPDPTRALAAITRSARATSLDRRAQDRLAHRLAALMDKIPGLAALRLDPEVLHAKLRERGWASSSGALLDFEAVASACLPALATPQCLKGLRTALLEALCKPGLSGEDEAALSLAVLSVLVPAGARSFDAATVLPLRLMLTRQLQESALASVTGLQAKMQAAVAAGATSAEAAVQAVGKDLSPAELAELENLSTAMLREAHARFSQAVQEKKTVPVLTTDEFLTVILAVAHDPQVHAVRSRQEPDAQALLSAVLSAVDAAVDAAWAAEISERLAVRVRSGGEPEAAQRFLSDVGTLLLTEPAVVLLQLTRTSVPLARSQEEIDLFHALTMRRPREHLTRFAQFLGDHGEPRAAARLQALAARLPEQAEPALGG